MKVNDTWYHNIIPPSDEDGNASGKTKLALIYDEYMGHGFLANRDWCQNVGEEKGVFSNKKEVKDMNHERLPNNREDDACIMLTKRQRTEGKACA